MEARRFHVLTLACARAVVDQIEHETGVEAYIKWPNDVVVDGRKVGGLLTETVFNGNHLDRVLVGIGLNLNQAEFSDPMVKAGAISLRQLADKEINREQFLCEYLHRVEHQYQRWHKHNDALLKNINHKILGYGRWIKLNVNGDELQRQYKLLGVNDKGQLAVIDGEGGLETFSYEQIRLITD
jgi:BirA family biotin operon repressor/biotin-[acetyl-CoA-carboxylase] ligase